LLLSLPIPAAGDVLRLWLQVQQRAHVSAGLWADTKKRLGPGEQTYLLRAPESLAQQWDWLWQWHLSAVLQSSGQSQFEQQQQHGSTLLLPVNPLHSPRMQGACWLSFCLLR
jgi:hypothetical protein